MSGFEQRGVEDNGNGRKSRVTGEAHWLPSARFAVDACYLSDRGRVRPINEDSACAVTPEDAAVLDSKGVLMVVADGMGGHEAGELASRMAVDCIRRVYYGADSDPQSALTLALHQANREILQHARLNPLLTGMGTTCTAIAVVNGFVWLAHVGDTRLYLIRDGNAYRMTQDHSVTMDLVKRGLLTLSEADHHQERNIILRAVGTRESVEAATWKDPFPVRPGDRLLVCSDGFYETVPDEEIGRICLAAPRSVQACEALLNTALERDGSDNITVAVLRVAPEEDDGNDTH
jgi:serine/threonine protein phosphatase PrpC